MINYTPKQLTDMSYGTFREVVNEAVKNPGGVKNYIVRELMRRYDQDLAKLIENEQVIGNIARQEQEGRVSKLLEDQIFMRCFENSCKEYENPSMQEYAAVTEEAYLAQQLIISELRRYK